MGYHLPGNEAARLAALRRYRILDTPPEEAFDRFVRLAARLLGTPAAMISLVDGERQWFKARQGWTISETPRQHAFCAHAILDEQVLIVEDAMADRRFRANPLVTSAPHLRFYAGAPLQTPTGERIGTLCVADFAPRRLPEAQVQALQELAQLVVDQLEVRRLTADLEADRHRADQLRAAAQARWQAVTRIASDAVLEIAPGGVVTTFNGAAERLFGYPAEAVLGRGVDMLVASAQGPARSGGTAWPDMPGLAAAVAAQQPIVGRRRNGEVFPVALQLQCVPTQSAPAMVMAVRDLSPGATLPDAARPGRQDPLTGLANRAGFDRALTEVLAAANAADRRAVLLLIDLDRFQDVNDAFGQAAGDRVLAELARRLMAMAGPRDRVFRLGGDRFALLLGDLARPLAAGAVARALRAALQRPLAQAGAEIRLSASIGIAPVPAAGAEAAAVLTSAEIALDQAKSKGGRQACCFFRSPMRAAKLQRITLTHELHQAIRRDEFCLHFQPVVRLADRRIMGCEALLRWRHPSRGLLLPGEFLGVAEAAGLAAPIGELVLRRALRQARHWRMLGLQFGRVGINLADGQIRGRTIVAQLRRCLAEAQLSPDCLAIEVTEGVLVGDGGAQVAATLRRLHRAGIEIAFDDFGTGFASLTQLRLLPVDIIKIDRWFVGDLLTDRGDAAIVQAIIGLAQSLGKKVVAEGIESEAQCACLCRLGCDFGQGYLFAKPLPAKQFARLLAGGSAEPAAAALPPGLAAT